MPDNSLHSGTSITTSSLHAASEVSQLNGKVMMEKHSKLRFTGSKVTTPRSKVKEGKLRKIMPWKKEAILALKVKNSPLSFQQAASKKGD